MKQTVNLYDFRRAFETMRPDNFSYEGVGVLFESFEQLADDTGTEVELDVIGICCEFSESTIDEVADNYDIDVTDQDDDEKSDTVTDYLQENTFVAGQVSNGSIVYQAF
jgi:hypothetical protein